MQNLVTRIVLLVLVSCYLWFLPGCASLPPRPDLAFEPAAPPAESGPIAGLADRFSVAHGAHISGFRLLIDAQEAYEARLALIDSATQSIDLQYFIWKGDATGILFFDRLLQAADRGVKVRAIVDDIWLGASTRNLAALNSHPNLEIRIFNPNPSRDSALGGLLHYLASFQALNRRMHNKLMIADNRALVAGGRNLGNEYFGLGDKFNFLDIDVLAVGAVVQQSSEAYDEYWNDNAVYPVSGWKVKLPENTLAEVRSTVADLMEEAAPALGPYPLERLNWLGWLTRVEKELITGTAHFLQDDPVKIEGRDYRLVDMLSYLAGPTAHETRITSPYLIPVDRSLQSLRDAQARGIKVKMLTNSLSSTNHSLVNSHYKKYRRPILRTGTQLYEFHYQPSESLRNRAEVAPVRAPFISLHAKIITTDQRLCFIGSLNFDPRAIVINSENGLLIESIELVAQLNDFLDEMMAPENSWRLSLKPGNRIEWRSKERTIETQPARGGWQGIVDLFGRFLPIESQL